MKRLLLFSFAAGFAITSVMAGGLVTNTNQSASWVRNPSRDASRGIDAVYYNPAGIMALSNGLHFSVSNQSIFQNKEVVNDYVNLNNHSFKGTVSAPLFPGAYAIYKMDKLAFSFGFNPIGGGGGAKFDKGLPSFELSVSDLVPALATQGATAYQLDPYFEGTSVFFGYQGGITYKVNDMLSVFGGVRFVTAKNTYTGHLNNVQLTMGGNLVPASTVLSGIASSATTAGNSTTALVGGGAGSLTLAQAAGMSIITPLQQAQLEGALAAFGGNTAMTIDQANTVFLTAANKYNASASLLNDQSADAEQTGNGITPIIGVNLTPMESLNIGVKYEFATKLDLTNKTTKDFTTGFTSTGVPVTMFPDGEKLRNDMPAMLSIGADYTLMKKLKISVGTHYYFDKNANYGKKIEGVYVDNSKVIDKNFLELALGLEYNITDKFLVSAGYLSAQTGVNSYYQNDLSYSNNSSTFGVGAAYKINDMLSINIGAAFTNYEDATKSIDHTLPDGVTVVHPKETYSKSTVIYAAGIDISLGK